MFVQHSPILSFSIQLMAILLVFSTVSHRFLIALTLSKNVIENLLRKNIMHVITSYLIIIKINVKAYFVRLYIEKQMLES